MIRSLVTAIAVTGLSLACVVPTASAAQGKGAAKMSEKKVADAKVLGFRGNRAGGCGEFKYWKDGQCMDARNKTPETK